MKFKKILSAALAAVMAASVMSVGMISSVSAADAKVLFDGTTKPPVIADGVETNPTQSSSSATIPEENNKSFEARIKLSSNANYIQFSTTGDFTLEYVYKAGGNAARHVLVNDSTGKTVATSATYENDKTNAHRDTLSVVAEDKTTATTYKLTVDEEISIFYLSIASSTPSTDYTITGNVKGLAAGDTFKLGDTTATVNPDGATYTATISVFEGAEVPKSLEASKTDYNINGKATETVTLSGSGTELQASPDLVFTSNVPYVEVIPSDTGYTFTGDGRIPVKANAKGGAYADEISDTTQNHIQVSEGKALLVDTSGTATTLYLPLTSKISTIDSGTLTISGTLSDFAASGSKWNILNFEGSDGKSIVDIRESGDDQHPDQEATSKVAGKTICLAVDTGEKASDGKTELYRYYPTQLADPFTEITYSIVFDYTNHSVSLTVNGGTSVTVTSEQEPGFATMSGVGIIAAKTGDGASRQVSLSNIKVETSVPVDQLKGGLISNTSGTSALYNKTDSKDVYLIAGVTDETTASDLQIKVGTDEPLSSKGKAYTGFKDSGFEVGVDQINNELGKNYKYIFAQKITDVPDDAALDKLRSTFEGVTIPPQQ